MHKYLYRKAGAEAYMLALADLLLKNGQEVGLWGTEEKFTVHSSQFTVFDELLVKPLNFDKREGVLHDVRKFGHMVWSLEAAEKFDDVLDEFEPEIIHLHNIYHHLSPSILPVAFRHRIPVVMTVHDYHLVNPNYSLFDHGQICERNGVSAIFHRCIKNSYLASAADVLEAKIHRALHVYERYVNRFLASTPFVKQKLIDGGFDEKKIELVPLAVGSQTSARLPARQVHSPPAGKAGSQPGEYILYAGRLAQEKGLDLLLDIAKALPEIKFKIAGTGPEIKNLGLRIKDEGLSNIELLGFLEKEELEKVIAKARLVVVPSLWYEVSSLAVLEAQALGKVVLATKVGALTDLIVDGKTGFLVEHGKWIDKIKKLWHDAKLLEEVGSNAKAYIKHVHDPQKHYEKIMSIYNGLVNG